MKHAKVALSACIALFTGVFFAMAGASGCGNSGESGGSTGGGAGSGSGGSGGGSGGSAADGGGISGSGGAILPDSGGPNECGNNDPNCTVSSIGPTGNPPKGFPLPSDDPAPDNVEADGVTRDPNGYLTLDASKAQFDFLWVANDLNYSTGLVSKIRTTAFPVAPFYREVARYVTVTCMSDPDHGGNEGIVLGQPPAAGLCADGISGCCARAEVVPGANGGHQPVQVFNNRPSRTAVDLNGDVWVANRAHSNATGQSSVTKIANSLKDCIDRNGNGSIETSSDANNDGIITTDCDDNNLPDNGATVCVNGQSHEFFGLDDECVLFTTNTGDTVGRFGRPLALGPGLGQARAYGPSDAWAGTYNDGVFYRIQGKTGAIIATVPLQMVNSVPPIPYGAAVDQFGILWAPNGGQSGMYYFDTNNPANQGYVEFPGGSFYGIAIDGYTEPDPNTGDPVLVQQIWLGEVGGSGAFRYRPKRDGTFAGLGQGTWAHVTFEGGPTRGRGLGVDNRTPMSFVWVALDGYPSWTGHIGRIPFDVADGTSSLPAAGNIFDTTQGMTTGAGVAFDGDIWGINQDSSSAVHFKVDAQGNMTGGPDVVPLDDKPNAPENFCGQPNCKPHPYTYSDFTGFGLRNFTNPHGYYAWSESGKCDPGKTKYLKVEWDADTPPGTSITMTARSSDDLSTLSDATWTGEYDKSPADLAVAPGPLDPNPTSHIEVLFELTTQNDTSPKLKSFKIVYTCDGDVVPK